MILKRRYKLVYVITAAIMLAVAAVALTRIAPRPHEVRAADALRKQGRLPQALDLYQDVLAREPHNEGALWGVAATHLARQDADLALEYLNRYLSRYPRGKHSAEARGALGRVRALYVQNAAPSPELAPGPAPAIPPGPSRALQAAWARAEKLERHDRLLDAVAAYAAIAESNADGPTRAAALERMARCEARRPPFDYDRVRHFYFRAQRAYRDINDLANAERCGQLAYLAQEYARVKGEREKLAAEQVEVETLARESVPEPGPREAFEETLKAYRAGDDTTALAGARALADKVPAAWFVAGMIHARQGDWDSARTELRLYLSKEPKSDLAEEARRELAAMEGKRPLLVDDFLRPAVRWRVDGESRDVVPATEAPPEPADGPCLRLDPGQGIYTSFDEAEVSSLSLRLYIPPSDAPPLPRLSLQPYGPDALTCAPLYLTERGFEFFGQKARPTPVSAGWRRLVIDVTRSVVSAQVDGAFIGEVPRESAFSGLHLIAGDARGVGPLYLDDVLVTAPLAASAKP